MWTPKVEIVNNSESLSISYNILPKEDGNMIKKKVIEKHQLDRPHKNSRSLFEKLNDCSSTNRENSISLLMTYPYQNEVFVFFEESVYGNFAIFTVYITDFNCNFLIAITSELTLVCNSIAADWLDTQLNF
jgi:hypothetical protein